MWEENAMKLQRRQFLTAIAVGAGAWLPAVSRIATAQVYPSKSARIIVAFAAGGSTDIVARLLAQRLSERLGQQFIIDNRPGAATNIATEVVVRAPPDGYTLLMVDASPTINATLYEKLNFNFIRDIAPVACTIRAPLVMLVNPAVPAKTVPEILAYAKANPGRLNVGTGGIGSTSHMAGELLKMMTGIATTHVHYRGGGPALTDLLGGQVQVYFNGVAPSLEYIRTGQLRALAVTSATRSEALPEIPTVSEFVPGYELIQWYGVGVPKSTPSEIVDKLNNEINAAVSDPTMKARFADWGGTAFAGSAAAFGRLIADDTEKWGRVIRAASVNAE